MISPLVAEQQWLEEFLEKNNIAYEDAGYAAGKLIVRTKSRGLEDCIPSESPNGTIINICVTQ